MISPAVSAVLLDAYADALPGPVAPKMWAENESGLTASVWHTCPKCNGERQVQWKGRTVGCDRCNSAGGWLTDAYSDDAVVVGAAHTSSSRPVLRVRCCWCDGSGVRHGRRCTPCDGEGDRPANTPLDDAAANGAAIHPVLVKVGAALDELAIAAPREQRILVVVHLERMPFRVDAGAYDDALVTFGAALNVRPPRWALQAAERALGTARGRWANATQRARRDAEARRLAGLGWSAAAIGRRLGVDRSTVGRILAA